MLRKNTEEPESNVCNVFISYAKILIFIFRRNIFLLWPDLLSIFEIFVSNCFVLVFLLSNGTVHPILPKKVNFRVCVCGSACDSSQVALKIFL